MTTLPEIREQFPQYRDLSDRVLADKLYEKHYKDMPREEFDRRVGYAAPPQHHAALGQLERHDFGDMYRTPDGELLAVNSSTDIIRDGVVYPRADERGNAPPSEGTDTALTRGMRRIAGNIRQDSTRDNVLAGGFDTAANWLDLRPEVGRDTLAPLGAATISSLGIGIAGRQMDNTLGVGGGRLHSSPVARAPADEAGAAAPPVPPLAGMPSDTLDAGYQMIADELVRAGRTPAEVRAAMEGVADSRQFNANSYAQDATAIVDIDNTLMRMASAIARQNPEAARDMRQFLHARQTGHISDSVIPTDLPPHVAQRVGLAPGEPVPAEMRSQVAAAMMADRGLPTREWGSPALTGAQTEKRLGQKFDTAADNYVPMGLLERSRDALRRAFLISDQDYHGHGLTGVRTEQKVIRDAAQAAQANYDSAYKAGVGVNLRDAITEVFERHIADAAANQSPAVEGLLTRARRMFRSGNIELKQFDRTKQELDDLIKRFLNRPDKSGVKMGGALNAMKNDLLAAVDAVAANGVGAAYKAARDEYSSEMDMLAALRLGRHATKENSELTADAFKALATKGEQKMARLGLLDGVFDRAQTAPDTHDVLRIFRTPRIEQILTEMIPRSKSQDAKFVNRPERFGKYLENQARMIEARNTNHGGSQTAANLAADQNLETLNTIIDVFKGSHSLWDFGQRALQLAFDKAFGMRADRSAALAHMLFTAEPTQRAVILENVLARMAPDRRARFNQIMQQYERTLQKGGPAALRNQLSQDQPPPNEQK
jgi:hypothetical protein